MPVQKMTPEEATRLGRNPFSGCKIYCLKKPAKVKEEKPKQQLPDLPSSYAEFEEQEKQRILDSGGEYTREYWIASNWVPEFDAPWGPELEAELPEELQDWDQMHEDLQAWEKRQLALPPEERWDGFDDF